MQSIHDAEECLLLFLAYWIQTGHFIAADWSWSTRPMWDFQGFSLMF